MADSFQQQQPEQPSASAAPALSKLDSNADVTAAQDTTAEHWTQWQQRRYANPLGWTEWSDHPSILGLLQQIHFGDSTVSPLAHVQRHYPRFAEAHALSLCCGDGSTERALVEHGVFGSMVGIDLTAERVHAACAARGDLAARLHYAIGDVNRGDFGSACFDVVFAKASLHHIEQLEVVAAGIRRCLKPGGRLVTLDFFGPSRFQWTDMQLEQANAFLAREVPAELRRRADGSSHEIVHRPTVQAMVEMDPSEAVRSGELYAFLQQHFQLEMDVAIGGTLLQLIFDGSIVNNFDPEDPRHLEIIERAVLLEQTLMATGQLPSDFRLIVARP